MIATGSTRRAACGDVARQHSDKSEKHDHARKGHGIGRCHSIEQRLHEPGQRERSRQTDAYSD